MLNSTEPCFASGLDTYRMLIMRPTPDRRCTANFALVSGPGLPSAAPDAEPRDFWCFALYWAARVDGPGTERWLTAPRRTPGVVAAGVPLPFDDF